MNKPDAGGGGFDPSAIQGSDADPTAMLAGMMGVMGIVWLVVIAFFIFLYWKIFSKAGFSGWLSLLLLVPIANLVVIIWFAFADWPALKAARGPSSPVS